MFIPALALISLSFFCLNSMSELVAFWAEYIWSLGVLVRFFVSFFGGAMIPLTFFPGWAQEALAYTPFPYLVHFPMQILFGEVDLPIFATNMGILSIWCLVFYSLSIVLWNKGKYSYTGVGI